MKVLFGYLTAQFRGGTKFQLDFARHFTRLEVGFVTSNPSVTYEEDVRKLGPIHVVPPSRQFARRLAALRELAREYDILYLNKATLHPVELLLVRAAGFRHVVFHSHSVGKDCKNPVVRMGYYGLHYLSRPFVGLAADRMYACSPEAGEWLFGRRFRKAGRVINNGVDAQVFRYDVKKRSQVRGRMEIRGACILHAGAFSMVKNQSYLIGAFAVFHQKYPDSVLLLAGQGELMEQAREKAGRLGVADAVRFLGQRDDVCDLMQAADLFVLPSILEGLPFSVVEAQAAGLPCIVTSNASRQVKITDLCGFFHVQRPEADLAAYMEERLKIPRRDTYQEIRAAGFDLPSGARELEEELLGLSRESRRKKGRRQ